MDYFVIGDADTVLGFSLVGVSGMSATNEAEARDAWEKALEGHHTGIIVITSDVAGMIRSTVDKYLFTESFPLVVEIPAPHGGKTRDIRALVNEAIGVSL